MKLEHLETVMKVRHCARGTFVSRIRIRATG